MRTQSKKLKQKTKDYTLDSPVRLMRESTQIESVNTSAARWKK